MNYISLISKIKKNKYQNYLNLTEKFYHSYITSRLATIDKLKRKRINKKIKISLKKNRGFFFTFEYLYKVFYKFNKTKKISKKDSKIIYSLYKKFETSLILRESYKQNILKKSNKETNLSSYILINFLIKKLENINYLQRINFVIKINDHLMIKKFLPEEYEINNLFIKNIKYEINHINKLEKL